ncbi:general odorant-binding protein 57a-like [Drosophila eugracilis]|uniref:general odorant-binding protein 57a-like n=1 Tax=Drosophila eugracilis TaxID=29029 RepID=UPI0007E68E3C|nr:general odorant-binding protein 57a-like [Drosophila eugracilis]
MLSIRLKLCMILILALNIQGKAGHPFDFFNESLEDFDDCLKMNNISNEEYEEFEEFKNLKNLLSENVEERFKCNIKCQLERQPKRWLNRMGKMDLELMNATKEASEDIANCMDEASDESCAYSFKLVICAFKAGHPPTDF